MSKFRKDHTRYLTALFVSFFLHGIILTIFKSNSVINESKEKLLRTTKNVPTIHFNDLNFISHKKLKEIKDAQRKQIVANELTGKKIRPINSKFAGEADQSFDRQTRAIVNGSFRSAGIGKKSGIENHENKAPVTLQNKKIVAKKEQISNQIKKLNLSDLGNVQLSRIEDNQKNEQVSMPSNEGKRNNKIQSKDALGSESGKELTSGLAQNNDFIEDIPMGEVTHLNTTEFKYYGFYHRIREKLEQYWGSSIKDKARYLYKSGRKMPASENLITSVQVVLDNRGNIVEIKIEGTSGIRELDQAAIESFNKAGPFPNPPKGLLVDGRAIIQWGFVVKS